MSTSAISNSSSSPQRNKVTVVEFQQKKRRADPITMLTAYDYPTALAVDAAGIDSILVGDSLGMVVLGYENTLPVSMDEMIHHCKAVKRGVQYAFLIGDMPFMSYQISTQEAVRNAGRFLQEGGMEAVKLEGGRERSEAVRAIVGAGIPVMGHLGLTPQSIAQLGGFRRQGRTSIAAQRLYEDALILQDAGCFSLVLESVPGRLAEFLSNHLDIPTIGIGAGPGCDGQVLVLHDVLGMFDRFTPSFAKRFTELQRMMKAALEQYNAEVQQKSFPGAEHTFDLPVDEWESFLEWFETRGGE